MQKRGLFRKAEQVVGKCQSEIFICIHQKESDKIYTFTSSKDYSLEKISDLILRDVRQGVGLKKNNKFDNTDFGAAKANIRDIQQIYPNYPSDEHY